MGIYDRDYIRRSSPPGRAGPGGAVSAMRMWSVNTWLIVICIGVFVIDGFLPTRAVLMETRLLENVIDVDPKALQEGPVVRWVDRRGVVHGPVGPGTSVFPEDAVTFKPLYVGGIPSDPVGQNRYQWMRTIEGYLHFSTSRALIHFTPQGIGGFEFWRFFGFQFLHANLAHLLFNMIALFFFGSLVEQYLGRKRYLAFYLLCGIIGAFLYLLLNLGGYVAGVRVPGLIFNDFATPLVGASAGIFGVLMAGAYLAPNATVLLFLIIPMRLRTLAYALVLISLVSLLRQGGNAGGEAGHLGGAIAGFYFIRHPQHLHGFFDILGRIDPTSHHYRGKERRARARASPGQRDQIDRILDKISTRGLQSLSEKEKRILREASQHK